MNRAIKNLWKTPGLFSCRHPAHRQFDYRVSPYHIFVEKKCFPSGCLEFRWRCRGFENGRKCPRGFKHVGRNCFSCKDYHESKLHYAPETSLDENALQEFMESMREFEGWIEGQEGRRLRFSGIIASVKPGLKVRLGPRGSSVRLDGFYASFDSGYLENDLFDDRIYMRIPQGLLSRIAPAEGDEMECDTIFSHDRGRIVLTNPRRVDLSKNGNKPVLNISRALVGRATGKIIKGLIEQCSDCAFCALADVDDHSRARVSRYKRFFCLRGITESENCPVRLEQYLASSTRGREAARRF
jgi:hypothetical protein